MALKRKKKIKISAREEAGQQAYKEAATEGHGRDADFSQLEEEQELEANTEEPDEAQGEGGAAESSGEQEDVREPAPSEQEGFQGKYLRALADLENFKKRSIKERSQLLKYQGERIFVDLLDIVDNFELALQHAEADPATLKDGVQLIHKMLTDVLSKWEVRPVEGLGGKFDPNKQSAISRVPSEDEEPGTVLNELKKAYFYKDKLIRAGEVVVATAPEPSAEEARSEQEDESEEQQAS